MDELKKTEENTGSELTPQQYFEEIKDRKHHITDAELVKAVSYTHLTLPTT